MPCKADSTVETGRLAHVKVRLLVSTEDDVRDSIQCVDDSMVGTSRGRPFYTFLFDVKVSTPLGVIGLRGCFRLYFML